ncbi:ATP-dependent sacrificial sulfur transferase LarE [Candidatus Pyrohabitans sp.]
MNTQLEELRAVLKDRDRIVLAFSGGLSSTFLAHVLKEMGKDFVAVTVDNGLLPNMDAIKDVARTLGIGHEVVEVEVLSDRGFIENSSERCYFCKKYMIKALKDFAEARGYTCVMDASDRSDLHSYRSAVIALYEEGVLTPLIDARLGREEIEEYAGRVSLPLPAPESCLATRIPHEVWIRREIIERVRRVEEDIRVLGFSAVRARVHDSLLRIQFLEGEQELALERRMEILKAARSQGFAYATIDVEALDV